MYARQSAKGSFSLHIWEAHTVMFTALQMLQEVLCLSVNPQFFPQLLPFISMPHCHYLSTLLVSAEHSATLLPQGHYICYLLFLPPRILSLAAHITRLLSGPSCVSLSHDLLWSSLPKSQFPVLSMLLPCLALSSALISNKTTCLFF